MPQNYTFRRMDRLKKLQYNTFAERKRVADIIQLLPDNIANQIAAGEVIQRPASAVKELLENAVDAGATEIKLFVADAGKSLVQVVDNGKGMSETDARLSFERHATSKIRSIDDLFHIRTMGFRGEALASIAAVAQVELKTKRPNDDAGTYIEIEDSIVKKQEPVAMQPGTSIAMKNLFFNVRARRNFLKSNPSELRHIIDEFIRVSMAFPQLFFSLTSNGQEVFHLEPGSLKQRIVQILGANYQSKLVAVNEETDYMNITGFVGKPETARKTRGEQFFFVNNRFIKSAYLNHAVMKAFDSLLPKDSFPMYALFISIDPAVVDINVHPTKQEIKFEDDRIIHAFVESAVKHALAQFSITPPLDFALDADIQSLDAISKPQEKTIERAGSSSPLFKSFSGKDQAHYIENKSELKNWKDFFEPAKTDVPTQAHSVEQLHHGLAQESEQFSKLSQLHNTFIIAQNDEGYYLIHQQNAHERILYERFADALESNPIVVQRSLFPATIDLNNADAALLTELLPYLKKLGFLLEPFGGSSFILQGTPTMLDTGNEHKILEQVLEQYKHFSTNLSYSRVEKLLRTMAMQQSIKENKVLSENEMDTLVKELFTCKTPGTTPNGKPTFFAFYTNELKKMFGR